MLPPCFQSALVARGILVVRSSVAQLSLLQFPPTMSSVLPSALQWELGTSPHPLHLLSLPPRLSRLHLHLQPSRRFLSLRTLRTLRLECSTILRLFLIPTVVVTVSMRGPEVGELSTPTSPTMVFLHHSLWSPMGVGVGCHTMQMETRIVHYLLYTLWTKPTSRYLLQLRPCQCLHRRLVSCRVRAQGLPAPSLPLILSPTGSQGQTLKDLLFSSN